MILEDFFTLTEMKGGLTVPSRVEELVNVMWKEKDYVVKNVGDTARQWAAVASTIAATDNRDCLDLFIQLDGLCFIDRWLKDVQTFSSDTDDSSMEETITVLLQALEKLEISNEKLISSGLLATVKHLLGHSCQKVQHKARGLYDSWKQGVGGDDVNCDVKNDRVLHDCGNATNDNAGGRLSTPDIPIPKVINGENCVPEPDKDKTLSLGSSDPVQQEKVGSLKFLNDRTGNHSVIIAECSDVEDRSRAPLVSTDVSNCNHDNVSLQEVTALYSRQEASTVGICVSPVHKKISFSEGQLDSSKLNALTCDRKGADDSSGQMGIAGISCASTEECKAVSSGIDAAIAQESVIEPSVQKSSDTIEDEVSPSVNMSNSEGTPASDSTNVSDEKGHVNRCSWDDLKAAGKDHDFCSNDLKHFSNDARADSETSSSRMEDMGGLDEDKDHSSGSEDLISHSAFLKPVLDSRSGNTVDKRHNMELDYGIVDALEVARQVARQVAQEVEGDVVDYNTEPSCSSSSEKASAEIGPPERPNSREKHDQQTVVQSKEFTIVKSHPIDGYSDGGVCLVNPAKIDHQQEKLDGTISSQGSEGAQENVDMGKGSSAFDLNLDLTADDLNRSGDADADGTQEGKAFAVTNTSVERLHDDADMTLSATEGADNSKPRQDLIGFDLNVVEAGDEFGKQILMPSGQPSGSVESSVEHIPKRSGGFDLDLNLLGDDGGTPPPASDCRLEVQIFQNRDAFGSSSPAYSMSSAQPLMRNFDLNDRPFFQSDSSGQGPTEFSHDLNPRSGSKNEASFISIMGTRVEVSGKDCFSRTVSMPNAKNVDQRDTAIIARTAGAMGVSPAQIPYIQTPLLGYNGLAEGQMMSFNSTLYGPVGTIPFMMDSRGAVVQQLMGSAPALPPPGYSQPPYVMAGAQLALNSATQSYPSFDLNSGMTTEVLNRDSGGMMQFLLPVQGRSMEQPRNNLQPAVGAKRKEPDGRWDPHPFHYKLQQPPWKE